MFFIKNIPIVIEPGVGALEAVLVVTNAGDESARELVVQLERLVLDEKTTAELPFIPCAKFPHLFSCTRQSEKNSLIVTYDCCGRISHMHTYNPIAKDWERYDVSEEYAGKTVSLHSVRVIFGSAKDADKFVECAGRIVDKIRREEAVEPKLMMSAFKAIARSRAVPVRLPVALEKSQHPKMHT